MFLFHFQRFSNSILYGNFYRFILQNYEKYKLFCNSPKNAALNQIAETMIDTGKHFNLMDRWINE